MLRSKRARGAASAGAVAVMALASALAAGKARRPFSVDAPEFRRKGPAGAKVSIVEFSDFECPACRYAEGPLRRMLELYGDKVRFTFKHFPLRMHEHARPAAAAAECAGRQGRFWEYHDALYDRQQEWVEGKADERLAAYAKELKLDVPAWEACRKDPATAALLDAEVKDAENAWVGSTPTFFINGRRFVGGKQLAELGALHVDRELRK